MTSQALPEVAEPGLMGTSKTVPEPAAEPAQVSEPEAEAEDVLPSSLRSAQPDARAPCGSSQDEMQSGASKKDELSGSSKKHMQSGVHWKLILAVLSVSLTSIFFAPSHDPSDDDSYSLDMKHELEMNDELQL